MTLLSHNVPDATKEKKKVTSCFLSGPKNNKKKTPILNLGFVADNKVVLLHVLRKILA